jgi:hypothetical protein
MNLRATHKLDRFGGIDNVNIPTEMEQVNDAGHSYFFQSAVNFDMTNKRHMRRRDGYRLLYDFTVAQLHSLWSHGNDCFFMAGDGLYRLNDDMSHTLILGGFSSNPMNFASVYGRIYFTNTTDIGWIDSNNISSLSTPTENFKLPMPSGHLMEFYNQVLYVAVGNIIYCSDPSLPEQYDYRHGLIPLQSRVTMLKACDDGLWISDSTGIYFLNGNTIYDFAFQHRMEHPVIERSAVSINGRFLGTDSVGQSVIMLTSVGICIGSNGGNFLMATADRYHGSDHFVVFDAAVRITPDRYQYLIMGYDYLENIPMELQVGLEYPLVSLEANHTWYLPSLQILMTATST